MPQDRVAYLHQVETSPDGDPIRLVQHVRVRGRCQQAQKLALRQRAELPWKPANAEPWRVFEDNPLRKLAADLEHEIAELEKKA